MRNGRPKAAVLILLLALFVLTGPPGTLAENTGSSSSAAAVAIAAVANTTAANTAIAITSSTNITTGPTAGNATTTVVGTSAATSTILRNLTVGYLTAAKGKLDNRQGLAISGALTLALKEASIYTYITSRPYPRPSTRVLQDISSCVRYYITYNTVAVYSSLYRIGLRNVLIYNQYYLKSSRKNVFLSTI